MMARTKWIQFTNKRPVTKITAGIPYFTEHLKPTFSTQKNKLLSYPNIEFSHNNLTEYTQNSNSKPRITYHTILFLSIKKTDQLKPTQPWAEQFPATAKNHQLQKVLTVQLIIKFGWEEDLNLIQSLIRLLKPLLHFMHKQISESSTSISTTGTSSITIYSSN